MSVFENRIKVARYRKFASRLQTPEHQKSKTSSLSSVLEHLTRNFDPLVNVDGFEKFVATHTLFPTTVSFEVLLS